MYRFLGWWWQWCLLLPSVRHLSLLINTAIICLIFPVYFLKVCLLKIVWNDIISNKVCITVIFLHVLFQITIEKC